MQIIRFKVLGLLAGIFVSSAMYTYLCFSDPGCLPKQDWDTKAATHEHIEVTPSPLEAEKSTKTDGLTYMQCVEGVSELNINLNIF